MKLHSVLVEIERLPKYSYQGGKGNLPDYTEIPKGMQWKPLPGGSGLKWAAQTVGKFNVYIMDPNPSTQKVGRFIPPTRYGWMSASTYDKILAKEKAKWERLSAGAPQVIGKLILSKYEGPISNAYQVQTITVDEDYRGMGIAKALYGIVLHTMGKTLVSGEDQTPGGRRNWVSLARIPGVEVKGLLRIDDNELGLTKPIPKDAGPYYRKNFNTQQRAAGNTIDKLVELGLQYVGTKRGDRYFAFDVVPGETELAPAVKTKLSHIYDTYDTLLYAKWVG